MMTLTARLRWQTYLAAVAVSLGSAAAQTNLSPQLLKASRLIGMTVEDSDGNPLGSIRNLAVDVRSGRLKYVILASGGFLGIGSKLKAVPPEALTTATAKRNTVALNVSRDKWRNAPALKV